jgi:hypothetical protein
VYLSFLSEATLPVLSMKLSLSIYASEILPEDCKLINLQYIFRSVVLSGILSKILDFI